MHLIPQPALMSHFFMFFPPPPRPCVTHQNYKLWQKREEKSFCIYDCLMTSTYFTGARKGQRSQF